LTPFFFLFHPPARIKTKADTFTNRLPQAPWFPAMGAADLSTNPEFYFTMISPTRGLLKPLTIWEGTAWKASLPAVLGKNPPHVSWTTTTFLQPVGKNGNQTKRYGYVCANQSELVHDPGC
jgi:hypothetical protein